MLLIRDCRVVALEEWKMILPSAVTSKTASGAAESSAKLSCKHRIVYKMEDVVLFSIFLPLEDYLQRMKSLESFRTIRTVHGFFEETTINDRDQHCYHYVQPELHEYCLTLLVSQIRQFLKLHTSL